MRKWNCIHYGGCLTKNRKKGKRSSAFCSGCLEYSPLDTFEWFRGDEFQGYYSLFKAAFGTPPRI